MTSKLIFRGSMPAPKHEHGEEMLSGVIVGRAWQHSTWVYQILLKNGHTLYNCAL